MGRLRKGAEYLELARGIEPPTCGLQNHCSAVELRQRPNPLTIMVYGHQPYKMDPRPSASCSPRDETNGKTGGGSARS